jgi:hypothetical protein
MDSERQGRRRSNKIRIGVAGAFVAVLTVAVAFLASAFNGNASGHARSALLPPTPLGSALPARLPESTGRVFYVSLRGRDSNPGTRARPWRTIQKAVNTLIRGQRALVAPGTYKEDISVHRALAGPRPATIEAQYPTRKPVIAGSLRLEDRGSAAASYWRFRNLKVDGTNSGIAYGIKVTNNTGTTTVPRHLEFYGMEIYGVYSSLLQPQGMLISGGKGATVPYRIDVYNTLFHDIGGPLSSQNQSHSLYVSSCEACVFANNVSHDVTGYGVHVNGGTPTHQGCRDSYIVNNTIVRQSEGGGIVLYSKAPGTPPNYLPGGNRIYNNIVTDVPTRPAYSSNFLEQVSGPANPENLWDRNLADIFGSLYLNGQGNDTSSIFISPPIDADPLFVDKAQNDFHLDAGSPAIGAGLPEYTPSFDFDGYRRTSADLGAFAFHS